MLIDLHAHSSGISRCCKIPAPKVLEVSRDLGLDGIVLTKLDGTAKGGFVFSLSAELSLPVIFAGVGEKMEDLEFFDSQDFVDAIL